jgi:hypothetical protein
LALALIHHLVIANNVPLRKIAQFFSKICTTLIIEFVPKSDSNMQLMLFNREDIFVDYNQRAFEKEFLKYFGINHISHVTQTERTIYYMQKR